ncbi:bleomycin resistance protein [Ferruginibacter albus]|uniref:bleomycin resistance protein n=1 Tax=Ferruginibacter albus TaxID=2875540 RepID=UPI001CC58833|nr:VOC family protein [Ferruginibacter albus]UAY51495.1 VOC family protein [Ferruginibacter albus]
MLLRSIPLLPTFNINKTIDFYEYKLGFTAHNYGTYLMLQYKKAAELHFFYTKDKTLKSSCYLQVDNVEDLYASFSIKEILHPERMLQDTPWGTREFSIVDNNGNVIRFGQKK